MKMASQNKSQLSKEIVQKVYDPNLLKADHIAFSDDSTKLDKDERSLLIHAVLANNLGLVMYLVEQGSIINQQDKLGWAALHYAAQAYLVSILDYLLTKQPDIEIQDLYGNTPLWRATFNSNGRGDAIKSLLRAGANPYLKNYAGISSYDLATTIANYDIKPFFAGLG